MWLYWLAGFGTGTTATWLWCDWREQRRREAAQRVRLAGLIERLRLYTHEF